jgi:hypothetical protein
MAVVNRYGQIRAEDEYGEYWIPTSASRQLSTILHDRSKNRLARLSGWIGEAQELLRTSKGDRAFRLQMRLRHLDQQFDFKLQILRRLFMLFGAEIVGN